MSARPKFDVPVPAQVALLALPIVISTGLFFWQSNLAMDLAILGLIAAAIRGGLAFERKKSRESMDVRIAFFLAGAALASFAYFALTFSIWICLAVATAA